MKLRHKTLLGGCPVTLHISPTSMVLRKIFCTFINTCWNNSYQSMLRGGHSTKIWRGQLTGFQILWLRKNPRGLSSLKERLIDFLFISPRMCPKHRLRSCRFKIPSTVQTFSRLKSPSQPADFPWCPASSAERGSKGATTQGSGPSGQWVCGENWAEDSDNLCYSVAKRSNCGSHPQGTLQV